MFFLYACRLHQTENAGIPSNLDQLFSTDIRNPGCQAA
jgi:hypothetical protein